MKHKSPDAEAPAGEDELQLDPFGLDLAALPKVSLHDHLDGGLRPATIVELAAEIGHELPADTEQELAVWFSEAAMPAPCRNTLKCLTTPWRLCKPHRR